MVEDRNEIQSLHSESETSNGPIANGLTDDRLLPVSSSRLVEDLLSLPDEVLVQIFEIFHVSAKEPIGFSKQSSANRPKYAVETLSLVCRLFRNLVLATPGLWQDITLDREPQLFFERSGRHAFNIDIDLRIDLKPGWLTMPSYMSFSNRKCARAIYILKTATPHIERCTSISIRATNEFDLDAVLEYLEHAYEGKTLTGLTSLHLDYGRDISTDGHDYVLESVLDPTGYRKTCFCTWDMPALQTVDSINVIPLLAAPSVTHFRLDLAGDKDRPDHRNITWGLHTLSLTLASFVNLSELSITLKHVKRFYGRDGPTVILSSVTKLSFTVSDVHMLAIERVLNRISTPNAELLQLELDTGAYTQLSGSPKAKLQTFFPEDRCYWPNLGTLELRLYVPEHSVRSVQADNSWGANDPVQGDWVMDAFTNLPPIRHLSISTYCRPRSRWSRTFVGFREYGRSTAPPIKTLRLANCNLSISYLLPSIQDIISAPDFEKLEVSRCPFMEFQDVRRIVGSDKALDYVPFELDDSSACKSEL